MRGRKLLLLNMVVMSFLSCHMGLQNLDNLLQLNDVLSDYLDSFLVIFLDDRGVSKWNFD